MSWQSIITTLRANSTELYVGGILLLGALTLSRVLYSLHLTQLRRRRKLLARNKMEAVSTESPIEEPVERAHDRGIDSINRHASVSRRLLVPLILVGTASLAVIPFLSRVPATMISIVVAVATVILGVAARPFIENAMSGLVITFSRVVNIGDTVRLDGDKYGTVEDISLSHTTIKLWDWRRYIVPNSKMLQQSFVNYSVTDRYEWAYISFTVSYEVDLERAREIALAVPKKSKYYAEHEEPQFWVMEMREQGYEVWLAAWANTPSEAWYLRADMRQELTIAFQKNSIPLQRMRHEIFSASA